MTTPRAKLNKPPARPYKLVGVAVFLVAALLLWFVNQEFHGSFTPMTKLTMLASRAGLLMDNGNKVTYNGVQIGRVASISEVQQHGKSAAKFILDVYPRYIPLIPANVDGNIKATTVFGPKYVSLTSPKNPMRQRITPSTVIDATSVTTEFNTLFQTISLLVEKVDPVKVNLTLSAAADALKGLGDKFGQSIINANAILDDLNPQMPTIRHDIQQFAALGDVYANAAPDLVESFNNVAITARTLNAQQKDLDAALLAAVGVGNTGAEVFGKGGPYLQRTINDLVPTSKLLDTYSPEAFCSIRNLAEVEPKVANIIGGGDGYALDTATEALGGTGILLNPLALVGAAAPTLGLLSLAALIGGVQNPYVYPDNLPRVNAHGGPGGAPGCWQSITRDLWPGPYLVVDDGASVAPYNHLDVASPYAVEYVWGRQVGEYTINP